MGTGYCSNAGLKSSSIPERIRIPLPDGRERSHGSIMYTYSVQYITYVCTLHMNILFLYLSYENHKFSALAKDTRENYCCFVRHFFDIHECSQWLIVNVHQTIFFLYTLKSTMYMILPSILQNVSRE